MGYLNNIRAVPVEQRGDEPRAVTRRVEYSLDVGRNLLLGFVLLVLVVAALVSYGAGNDGVGRVFVDLVVAVLAGGLGINVGERGGAREAAQQLNGPGDQP